MASSTVFGPPQDLETDSKSFSISGAHLVKDRLQKLYLGFCIFITGVMLNKYDEQKIRGVLIKETSGIP